MRKLPFLLWLGWGYVGFFILWLVLRLVFFDRLWSLLLINSVADYLFMPLSVLLVASLLMWRWRLLLGLSIPAIAFGVMLGVPFLPLFANTQQQYESSISNNCRLPNDIEVAGEHLNWIGTLDFVMKSVCSRTKKRAERDGRKLQ